MMILLLHKKSPMNSDKSSRNNQLSHNYKIFTLRVTITSQVTLRRSTSLTMMKYRKYRLLKMTCGSIGKDIIRKIKLFHLMMIKVLSKATPLQIVNQSSGSLSIQNSLNLNKDNLRKIVNFNFLSIMTLFLPQNYKMSKFSQLLQFLIKNIVQKRLKSIKCHFQPDLKSSKTNLNRMPRKTLLHKWSRK